MARGRLTDLSVKAIRPRAEYFEVVDGTSGLRLAIHPSGTKSWVVRYRRPVTKTTAKLTLGKYPPMSLAQARVRAAEARAAVAAGTDPGEAKRRAKADAEQAEASRRADTVELHVKLHLERTRREVGQSHWRQATLALGRAVLAWRGRPVAEIARRDVRALCEQVAATSGPVAGNRMFGHVRHFFAALVEHDVIAVSPTIGLRRPTKDERARERVLSADEIRSLWLAADAVGGPACSVIKLLLLTGQRRSEVAGMTWGEINGGVWSLPGSRTKNGEPHSIPLPKQALAEIEQQPRIGDYVFSNDGTKPVGDFTRPKKAIDAIMRPTTAFVVHDIRRTVATTMAEDLRIAPHIIEVLLNHISGHKGGVAGIYNRATYLAEKTEALQRWASHVETLVTGRSTDNIVTLRR
jgi:integrase